LIAAPAGGISVLSRPWIERKPHYDFVIVGSGYGGAIAAARLASARLTPPPSVCLLERGKEWLVGSFPDALDRALQERRTPLHPLGLYEFLTFRDISILKGSGLGGTSLVNANVVIEPDAEVFELAEWPSSIRSTTLAPYFARVRQMLAATPHPRAAALPKVQALDRRAAQMGAAALAVNIAVNFAIDGENAHGIVQRPCIDCGDCVSGCNVGAKNTLAMNYLPMAVRAGAEIYTQAEVTFVSREPNGRWRVHGRHIRSAAAHDSFEVTAQHVILAAGSLNTTEILLRSELNGLSVSPRLGSGFGGNGDFFGLAYNGDYPTQVLGFGNRPTHPGAQIPPGPTIVAAVRYEGATPVDRRMLIQDVSLPSAYVEAARVAFAALRGEDTDSGDTAAEARRRSRDLFPLVPHDPQGALNHTMLYLCMGFDDARGAMVLERPWFAPEGQLRIHWDDVGRQVVFSRMNEELRRHARAQGASFVQNPLWRIFDTRHLITAHPLGGCPIGEDAQEGAVDEHGRVFAADGSLHEGLFVADGSLVPTALGANPLLTIGALAERIVERKIQELEGLPYPAPAPVVTRAGIDPMTLVDAHESVLEAVFRRTPTLDIETLVNRGTHAIDRGRGVIRNDRYWKGYFPKGHVLNAFSTAIFTGFKKRFFEQDGRIAGVTSDTDNRIMARNTLEEITVDRRTGDLDAGRYILLRYADPPWQGFYDILRAVNEDLLIGRVYLGTYPHGVRLFTFPMTRVYRFSDMTVDDHRALYAGGSVPTREQLHGVWRMDVISNANHLARAAYLKFDLKPDGRLESRYQLLGLMEGLVMPTFLATHFELQDFTRFRDEIRMIDSDYMVGSWTADLPAGLGAALPSASLGVLHVEEREDGGRRFGFHYTLSRAGTERFPTNRLLAPFLDVHLPAGIGMTFDEEMVGWYFPGLPLPDEGREGTARLARRIPRHGVPEGAVACGFSLRMTVRDLNEFIEGSAHEARTSGSVRFDSFGGSSPAVVAVDTGRSTFNYVRTNAATGEAEMRYHLEFRGADNRRFLLDGRKYMQKDERSGWRGLLEILEDYTTLFCRLFEAQGDRWTEIGSALLKFRTFENLAAVGNLAEFLRSFTITGTEDPVLQLQARMRFLAFTAQFVQQEYDPLAPPIAALRNDVRDEVARGAETPDYFSSRPTADLHAILREAPTRPLASLINTSSVSIDVPTRRIFRDVFWKGSFARDTLLGWEERVRTSALGADALQAGAVYAGGAFWKRFDRVENGVATGYVVNYELATLPGDPLVEEVEYPDDDRRYFKKGDRVLLLRYRNHPYRPVYDTIKVIDEQNAIGVMHIGDFPRGLEFAAFVMARHNYPFEHMSVEDHRLLFEHPQALAPDAPHLSGAWTGRVVLLARADSILVSAVNPVSVHLTFRPAGSAIEAACRFGLAVTGGTTEMTEEQVRPATLAQWQHELRLVGSDTLIGTWTLPRLTPELFRPLERFLEGSRDRFTCYFVITRT
jgi:cholesterol oxidase